MTRAILITLVGLAALIALPLLASVTPVRAQDGETVRIIARLQADGDIEFGLRTSEGNQLPPRRIFSASITDNGWKVSSPIEVPDGTQVRIIARRSGETRVEFGLRIDEPRQVFLPPRRLFSRSTPVDSWRVSSPIELPARDQADIEEPTQPEEPEPQPESETEPEAPGDETDDTGTEETDEASDVERISGGHRDGLIVEGNIVGDPDAPVLIVEYGDPF
ncbi:MAG: hypothetical protein OXI41_05380 [Chloroflexota bacterium]|nr:hypothetical protein [Chloroflexota bacterium]MDE2894471.1 hypothetical protein [Chloroflexota bacterium]